MKIVCLDADTLGKDANLELFKEFGEFVSYNITKPEQTIERLQSADVVITNKVLITDEVMANTNLKLICVSATGINNIDANAAKERGIPVKNVAGYSTNSVVQQTFASLLALTNAVSYYGAYGTNGEWVKSEIFTNLDRPISEIAGKEFGIIGLGTIGKKVATIAEAFGAKVRYYSTSGANTNNEYVRVSLDSLLKTCDIISIHAPLNDKTANLIGEEELNKMKNGAILMNFGRGGIVDENALAKAIDEKNLKVALDVLEKEPMIENHPLLSVKNKENLIITPHIAWASNEARATLVELVAKNIKDFVNGK
ncbi:MULTISPECIES: D-2-hydroxyacid dehydrogenase [unclassified Campylobacter]|uniref:D-2-hydroxyacid dehydrogenase n=2 Tax=Campylobacter TaxID=194 RepID=UPI0022E9A466|nr:MULTISPECIES: D-2-hydroxyacid dehydrogenase [unclassified Campylobacter]MDA3056535.1 D-2-hydroxyacid dehydrogenase [Campylobacter sp. CN_NA1]MDA3065631.1 D-2-hydroxyacid dehydrogenase [Campylobacter sp. CN_NE4]MDA3069174.1 D-2-hydroxyacid dehydrogenase [Campylobacter sp. CN_NE3]MDA3083084.1 D-2-hydroxyacid dehydrogenase [Campylobacter sp. CN_EL2]MDA3084742.1 D-2-hydroxyacid dehydrogenase [Campylobacter sp. CN_NE1]